MNEILIGFVSIVIGALAWQYQRYTTNQKIKNDLEHKENKLYYSLTVKIVSIISLIFLITLLIYFMLTQTPTSINGYELILGIILMFICVASYWNIESFYATVAFNDNELFLKTPWKKNRNFLFKDIEARRDPEGGIEGHVFLTVNGDKFFLSHHLVGLYKLFDTFNENEDKLHPKFKEQLKLRN